MAIDCDVLVVGAGPAGCIASLVLAKNNVDTVLLEKNKKLGAHTKTKIDIAPQDGLDEIINELQLNHSGYGNKSIWHSPNYEKFIMESDMGEFYFKRGSEDDSLENNTAVKAQNEGCRLLINRDIVDIKVNKNTIKVQLLNGDIINSKFLIASDGKDSIVLKKCFGYQKGKELGGYGITGYDFDITHGTSEIFFNVELLPGGYIYLAKDNKDLSSIGIVLDPLKISGSPEHYLNRFLDKNKHLAERINGTIISKFQGRGYISALNCLKKGNILFTGDAGRLASPFFGYGMRSAIISGYLAANALVNVLKGDMESFEGYDVECKERLNLELLTKLGTNWEKLENNDLDIFFEILNKIDECSEKLGILEKIKILNLLRKSKRSKQLKFILNSFEEMA